MAAPSCLAAFSLADAVVRMLAARQHENPRRRGWTVSFDHAHLVRVCDDEFISNAGAGGNLKFDGSTALFLEILCRYPSVGFFRHRRRLVRDTFSYDRGWKIVRMEVVVTVMDHNRKETMGSSRRCGIADQDFEMIFGVDPKGSKRVEVAVQKKDDEPETGKEN